MARSTPAQALRDLIEVPPIRTVIQLADLSDREAAEEILDSFVFTGEVRDLFTRLLTALSAPTGLGAFLKGHYGSGKSHCLAFLQRLLQHDPHAWAHLPEGLPAQAVRGRSYLVVPIALLHFPASASLEEIVMAAVEKALDAQLANRSRLLDRFRTYILPRHRDELPDWETLPESEAFRQAMHFLSRLEENPLRLSYDRRQVWEQVSTLLGPRSLVLLLDELSEFLKSKPQEGAFNEDIRYLQFLGEWSQKLPLFVVASLQESLEDLGGREHEGYQRIKERYPLRFSLSARHVGDLVEGRLIHKRPGAQETISSLWSELDAAFPGVVSQADFQRTYPVHPATLEVLQGLMPLFSRHRGVVDFVHTQLAGNPIKGVTGLLDEPPDRLLTADAIFDHFRERIQETPELSAYVRVVWDFLETDIPRVFPSERERELAGRLVKLLILAEISPVPVPRDAPNLARMACRRVSRVAAEANLEYARNLLDGLCQRSSFVVRQGTGYGLEVSANVNQVTARRLRELARDLQPDWLSAAARVNRPALPLAELPSLALIKWQNTLRRGYVRLQDLAQLTYLELSSSLSQITNEEEDFALYLGLPVAGQAESAKTWLEHARACTLGACLLFWIPAEGSSDLRDQLLTQQARRALLAELHKEGNLELKRVVESAAAESQERLERTLFDLYMNGHILHLGGRDLVSRSPLGWEHQLGAMLAPRLAEVFPRHKEVAPELDALHRRNLELLWTHFLSPGRCPEGGPGEALITQVMMRLGVVEHKAGEYLLAVDPAKIPLVTQVVDRLPAGQKIPIDDLTRTLAKGPWGLSRMMVPLLLAALVQSGRATPYASGRATSLESIKALLDHKVDALGPGRLLDPALLPRLTEIAWLWPEGPPSATLTAASQKELWETASARLERVSQAARGVAEVVQARANLGNRALPLERLHKSCQQVERLAEGVGRPAGPAQGLKALLAQGAAQVEPLELISWHEFLSASLREFQAALVRTEEMGDRELAEELRALEQSTDPVAFWQDMRPRYQELEAGYRSRYLEAHSAYYRHPAFTHKRELTGAPEWRALNQLALILGLESDLPGLRRSLEELPEPCRRPVEEQLALHLRCECGLTPDQEPPLEVDLFPRLREALAQAALWLEQSDRRERLEDHLRRLREVGQDARAERFEQLLSAAGELGHPGDLPAFWSRASGQLAELLDRRNLDEVNRALSGRSLVVRRDPGELVRRLEGQRLLPGRARQIFEDWLKGGGLPEEAWIHVAQEGEEKPGVAAWLGAWLAQHGLEATPAMRRRYDLRDLPAPVGEAREVEPELAPLLQEAVVSLEPLAGALAESLFEGISRDLCRRALRQSLEDAHCAARLTGLESRFPHCEEVRALALALEKAHSAVHYPKLAGALREWARARHLDEEAGLMTPDLEESIGQLLEARLAGVEVTGVALEEVPDRLLQPRMGPAPVVIFLVDALRWDLWELLRPMVEAEWGPAELEEPALAPCPTLTVVGREALLASLGRPVELLKAADQRRHRERALELLKQGPPLLVLHLTFIDERVHESDLELWPLFSELALEARARLLPLVRAVKPGSLVLLTADHGFLAPEEGRRKGRSRAPHGGPSPQERVVPAAVWQVRGRG